MKLYKILFLLIFCIVIAHPGLSQAVISFEETEFDFGKVAEGTQATHEFVFRNTGTAPLVLSKVQASCGCTTPFWTKEPVLPGKTGVISASYNSSNRPGAFNKSITITSNANPGTTRVFIKGNVVPVSQAQVVYSKEELESSAKLTVEKSDINLGKVEIGQIVPFDVAITNNGKKNLVISDLNASCNCINFASGSTNLVQPGKTVRLKLLYSPTQTGTKSVTATILSNDLAAPETKIKVSAEIVESLTNKSILKENATGYQF